MLFEIQNFTEQNKINREAKQGANRPERVEAAAVWLPVCVFTDNHFMARFQDWSSSSMRTFVCMFHLIFLAVERVSQQVWGWVWLWPLCYLVGSACLRGFSDTRFLYNIHSQTSRSWKTPGTRGRKGNLAETADEDEDVLVSIVIMDNWLFA